MATLFENVCVAHDWAKDQIHALCDKNEYKNAHAIQKEFEEWLDPTIEDHEVIHLQFLKNNYTD
jgi:hypothetical protein